MSLGLLDRDDFVEQYGAALAAGQGSVLVGAGLSRDPSVSATVDGAVGGLPDWKALLESLAKTFDVPPEDDLTLVAQYVANQKGGCEAIRQRLIDVFAQSLSPTRTHLRLMQLPTSRIWTTNYDNLLERAIRQISNQPHDKWDVAKHDSDLATIAPATRFIYKMHGHIEQTTTVDELIQNPVVLCRDNYDRYPENNPRFWRLLQAHFLTTSFLFVGFSLSDPNFESVFRIARTVSDVKRPHFALLKTDPTNQRQFELRAEDLKSSGINVVGLDDYSEIVDLLVALAARSRPSNVFISGSDDDKSKDLTKFADFLGRKLGETPVSGIVAASTLGASAGYELASVRRASANPSDFIYIRRAGPGNLDDVERGLGQIQFVSENPNMLRRAALMQARCVVVIGGDDGTAKEIEMAHKDGLAVVPVGWSGGAARDEWNRMAPTGDHRWRSEQDAFSDLNSNDLDTVLNATVRLVLRALSLE